MASLCRMDKAPRQWLRLHRRSCRHVIFSVSVRVDANRPAPSGAWHREDSRC